MAKTTFPQNTSTLESTKPADNASRVAQDMRNALSAIFQGDLSPLRSRAQSTPNMTLKVNGSLVEGFFNQFFRNLIPIAFAGGNSPTVTAPTSNPRIDILTLNSGGSLAWVIGVEHASPVPLWSGVPGDSVPLCLVYCKTTMDRILNYEDKDTDATEGYLYQDVRPFFAMGASKFTQLTDAPTGYAGHGTKQVRVKSDETGLEFVKGVTGAEIDVMRDNLAVLAFRQAVQGSLSVQKFEDGVMDDYQDQSGIDTVNSANQGYDAAGKLYAPARLGGGIDSNTKLVVQNNAPQGGQSKTISFDGSGDYLSVADHADWDFGTGDFTLELYVRFNSVGNSYFINRFRTGASGNSFAIRYSGGVWDSFIEDVAGPTASLTPVANKWYHVALSRSGTSLRIFINGKLYGTTTNSTSIGSDQGITLGQGGGVNFVNGWMKSIRISNNARYTADFTPSLTPFTADANTKFLLLAEEAVGATTFVDSETTPKTVTTNGDCKIVIMPDYRSSIFIDSETAGASKKINDLSDSKIVPYQFNKSAGFFPNDHSASGNNSKIVVPNHSDWNFGSGDYTVEMWLMFCSTGGNGMPITRNRNTGAGDWELDFTGSAITWGTNGSLVFNISYTVRTMVWYHFAVVRSGTTVKMYINGIEIASTTNSHNITGSSADLDIGADALMNWGFHGWLKELRVSNSARYTATFTPSTSQFSSDANTKLLLHFDTPATAPLAPCLALDGTGDYLSVADHADWDFGTGDWTVECWVKWAANPVSTQAVAIGSNANGISLAVYDTGGVAGFHVYFLNTEYYSSHAYTPVKDRWYHFAACRSGNNLRLFIDGIQNGSTEDVTGKNMNASTAGVFIGSSSALNGQLNGFMKNVRISNSARYTANFVPSLTPFSPDANTKLLLLLNENNGATAFVDSASTPKTVTTNGNSVIKYEEDYRNTIFKDDGNTGHKMCGVANRLPKIDFVAPFGTGAIWLDGSDDGLDMPDHADFDYGSGDFTLDAWVKFFGTQTSYQTVIGQTINDGSYSVFGAAGGLDYFVFYSTGVININAGGTVRQNTWYHLQAVRSGSSWYLFVNGTLVGSDSSASAWPGYTSKLTLGYEDFNGAISNRYYLNGMIDNIRISKGIARNTAAFNPPASDYDQGTIQNMTLIAQAQTAQAAPSAARVILLEEDVDAIALNTDLKAWASRDGSNYDQITLINEGNYDANKKILAGNIDPFVAASGVSMKYKLTTHNAKDLKVHAAGLMWK